MVGVVAENVFQRDATMPTSRSHLEDRFDPAPAVDLDRCQMIWWRSVAAFDRSSRLVYLHYIGTCVTLHQI